MANEVSTDTILAYKDSLQKWLALHNETLIYLSENKAALRLNKSYLKDLAECLYFQPLPEASFRGIPHKDLKQIQNKVLKALSKKSKSKPENLMDVYQNYIDIRNQAAFEIKKVYRKKILYLINEIKKKNNLKIKLKSDTEILISIANQKILNNLKAFDLQHASKSKLFSYSKPGLKGVLSKEMMSLAYNFTDLSDSEIEDIKLFKKYKKNESNPALHADLSGWTLEKLESVKLMYANAHNLSLDNSNNPNSEDDMTLMGKISDERSNVENTVTDKIAQNELDLIIRTIFKGTDYYLASDIFGNAKPLEIQKKYKLDSEAYSEKINSITEKLWEDEAYIRWRSENS